MRARVLSLLMRLTSSPLLLGIVVAAALIAAETLALYPLRQVAPKASLGVVYLVGVLVVSISWGAALGVVTAVLSTAAFDFFHVPPVGSIVFGGAQGQAALVILLTVGLLLGFVAALARSRAIEADERRREADLAAEMARLLLRTDDLRSALPDAAARLTRALGLPPAAIELEAVAGEEGRASFPLRDGDTVLGTLRVSAELPMEAAARLRERVVPSVEALLRAAREREAMRRALEASRDELGVLAKEQAALRRVATLVAHGVAPVKVFAAVSEEVGRLLPVDLADIGRYEPDGTVTVVAPWGKAVDHFPVGSRWSLGGKNLSTIVFETGRPARMDNYADASGPIGVASGEARVRSAVATPIIVEGRLWGVMTADSTLEQPLPDDSEARLASFTELVATAIANAESRAAIAASRARIAAAADESRRRIERDLHDGAQQRLVHAVIVLKLALRALKNGDADAGELVAEALRHAEQANSELRELAHGILPAALTRGGLREGVEALVSRVPLPVSVDVSAERLPADVEATVYFVISESLTNVVKHARADRAKVTVQAGHGGLRAEIRDDGIGGADSSRGSGLIGLSDRIEALGGKLEVTSPAGSGTTLLIEIPPASQKRAESPES
jgi:signal transduction histidine kinase